MRNQSLNKWLYASFAYILRCYRMISWCTYRWLRIFWPCMDMLAILFSVQQKYVHLQLHNILQRSTKVCCLLFICVSCDSLTAFQMAANQTAEENTSAWSPDENQNFVSVKYLHLLRAVVWFVKLFFSSFIYELLAIIQINDDRIKK